MAANTAPIYSVAGDLQHNTALMATAASVVYDCSGTIGTDIYLLYTAPANGGFVQRIRFKYAANGTTTSVACVAKIWLSSVSSGTPTIASQAQLIDEIALPATGALTTTATAPTYDLPLNFVIPYGSYLLCKITVAQSANTGWIATVIGGTY